MTLSIRRGILVCDILRPKFETIIRSILCIFQISALTSITNASFDFDAMRASVFVCSALQLSDERSANDSQEFSSALRLVLVRKRLAKVPIFLL